MRRAEKAGLQSPDLSFFVPGLADQVAERKTDLVREARWQPRWTILLSLGTGLVLWAGLAWLVGL